MTRPRELASFAPKTVSRGQADVVVVPPDLGLLPVLTTWPGDGGPFVTLPVVVTKGRDGRRNAGMYRLQVFDARTTGMHWHVHHDGAANFRESDGRLEVAVALGTDPLVTYAATAPLPAGVDELMFAGFLRGEPVELAPCETVALEVPADAEIVLEGYVEQGEERDEGPCGDHTGYYSLVGRYPVFHVTAMRRRRDAIYPATIVGRPPMEDCFLGKATERLFLPLLKLALPELVDLELPLEGVFNGCAIVSIRKAFAGHAFTMMNAIWGRGQMRYTKFIVVVDEHVDVHDPGEVAWRVFNNVESREGLPHRARPAGCSRPREPAGALRRQDGHRCHAFVAGGGIRARVARRAGDGSRRGGEGHRALAGARAALHVSSLSAASGPAAVALRRPAQ